MFSHYTRRSIAAAIIATLALAAPAMAETVNYMADLKAESETPATTSKGTGMLKATFDTASKKFSWEGSYKDLTGDATAAHFHGPAAVGASAGVALPVETPKPSFAGSATLTDAQAADLAAGMWYFNIHTAANPKGEIRGQVVKGGM